MSSKVVSRAILGSVYTEKTIFEKSPNATKWTPTDDNHKTGVVVGDFTRPFTVNADAFVTQE